MRCRERAGQALWRSPGPWTVPISESVTATWERLVWDCRNAGIQRTVNLADALIAATAIDLGLPVVIQNDDYEQMSKVHPTLRFRKV
jgi:predicted nucleic acid-binding protein